MNVENNRSAAGLRRSAIAERLRLKQEWLALKEVDENPLKKTNQKNAAKKFNSSKDTVKNVRKQTSKRTVINDKENFKVAESIYVTSDVLRGVVVLVEVGTETKALPLRAALSALGATIMPTWSPLVTHVVWTQGGCRNVRAKARALACHLVSPLWVEACASSGRRLPEKIFPAPTRPSDLPSPATLKRLLKKAEHENISLADLLTESPDSDRERPVRLRISSETEHDTTNTSHDMSHEKSVTKKKANKSLDSSRDSPKKTTIWATPDTSRDSGIHISGEEVRVNTAPRRALPISMSPERPTKSRRKLFTQKEPDPNTDEETDAEKTPEKTKKTPSKMTPRDRRQLARAERMARRLLSAATHKQTDKHTPARVDKSPNIVLTGMSGKERQNVCNAIRSLNGRIQSHVNRKTTHVLLGSCMEPSKVSHVTISMKCNCPERTLIEMFSNQLNVDDVVCPCWSSPNILRSMPNLDVDCQTSCGNNEINKNSKNQESNSKYGKKDDKNGQINQISEQNKENRKQNSQSEENRQILDREIEVFEQLSQILEQDRVLGENGKILEQIEQDGQVFEDNDPIFDENGQIEENGQQLKQNGQIVEQNCQNSKQNDQNNVSDGRNEDIVICSVPVPIDKPRTVNALLGAVRGCRVLNAKWAIDSMKAKRWLLHIGYEVPHLMKISQKARVERSALGLLGYEYAYNVFRGMRVFVSPYADQKDAIIQLLTLCGAIVQNPPQNGGRTKTGITQDGGISRILRVKNKQNGRLTQNGVSQDDFDLKIGTGLGEVSSKWVFDSVAASRMRTTRRYINQNARN